MLSSPVNSPASSPVRGAPSSPGSSTFPPPAPRRSLPAAAGVIYVLAWIVGLVVYTGPPHGSPDATVLARVQEAGGSAVAASLLVHGVAAAAFLVVAVSFAGTIARLGRRRAARAAVVAATVATIASAAQVAAAVTLSNTTTAASAGVWFDVINRLDGIKLLAMAIVVGTGAIASRRRDLTRWLGVVGAVLAVCLALAGVGFLAAATPLTVAAAPALLLLFVWVPATARSANH